MHKFIKISTYLVIFCAGWAWALFWGVPFLSVKNEVGIADIANLLLTIVVAILIPISLSPLITNKRKIKDFLIDEAKDCILFLCSIKEMIESLSLGDATTEIDRLKINSKISRDLSIKITSLVDQLNLSFEGKSDKLIKNINENYKEYWQETTSGELMSKDFKFTIRFCAFHDKSYKKLEASLKKAVHEINNY